MEWKRVDEESLSVTLESTGMYILTAKEIGNEEPYYNTKNFIFSFNWEVLAALNKASTIK